MEELRSTEILDKEIEAEARRNAEQILIDADEEAKKLIEGVDGRVKEASEKKAAFYAEKLAALKRNLEAAVPLEKERFLAAFYAQEVADAFNAYLEGLGSEKRLSLIAGRLEKAKAVLEGKKWNARVFGFAASDAKKMLEKALGKTVLSVEETTFEKSGDEAALLNTVHEGIMLESEDASIRCRFTIDQIVSEIKDTYSAELAEALFSGRLPQ